MPRPIKCRRVCSLPTINSFGPVGMHCHHTETIVMSVEEFETIRLIDFEGMMQEECAEKMEVARTTVQRIYNDARKKLAISLVEGKILNIEGGDYKVRDENDSHCVFRRCNKAQCDKQH